MFQLNVTGRNFEIKARPGTFSRTFVLKRPSDRLDQPTHGSRSKGWLDWGLHRPVLGLRASASPFGSRPIIAERLTEPAQPIRSNHRRAIAGLARTRRDSQSMR